MKLINTLLIILVSLLIAAAQCQTTSTYQVTPNVPYLGGQGIRMYVSSQGSSTSEVDAQDDTWKAQLNSDFPKIFARVGMTTQSTAPIQRHRSEYWSDTYSYDISTREILLSELNCVGNVTVSGTIARSAMNLPNQAPIPSLTTNGMSIATYSYVENRGTSVASNALYFNFTNPPTGFGTWISAPTNSSSVPITIRLLDSFGNRIGNDYQINESEYPYGLGTTRFIGFIAPAGVFVRSMLVVVGSADIGDRGYNNHLAFIGSTFVTTKPTAATANINSRLVTPSGRGLANAYITLTDTVTGEVSSTYSSSFGRFNFNDLSTEHLYILQIHSRKYRFNNKMLNLSEDFTEDIWANT